jgi:hypothetical protein
MIITTIIPLESFSFNYVFPIDGGILVSNAISIHKNLRTSVHRRLFSLDPSTRTREEIDGHILNTLGLDPCRSAQTKSAL